MKTFRTTKSSPDGTFTPASFSPCASRAPSGERVKFARAECSPATLAMTQMNAVYRQVNGTKDKVKTPAKSCLFKFILFSALVMCQSNANSTPTLLLVGTDVRYVNPNTGEYVVIRDTVTSSLNSLAKSPSGTLWGVNANNMLVTLNPITGQATEIRPIVGIDTPSTRGITFDASGNLYAIQSTILAEPIVDTLWRININTGQATLIGETGWYGLQSLATAPNGTIYSWDFGYCALCRKLQLCTINPITGAASDVNAADNDSQSPSIQTLIFAPDGRMWGIGNGNVYSINAATGVYSMQWFQVAHGATGGGEYIDVDWPELSALSVSPTTLTPTCIRGDNASSDQFELWNSGGGILSYTISENISWLSCSPPSGSSSGEHDTINVSYSTAGLAAGTYNGTITVTALGARGSPQSISVTLTVNVPAPQLSLSPTTLASTCTVGQDAASQSFEVWNSGGGSLSYSVSESIGWLSCTPTGGTSTGERDSIAVDYTTAGLAAGTYNGTITVTAAGATGSPQAINVTLAVVPPPHLSVNPTALDASCTAGQNAASQSFEVWNSGGGTLNYSVSESISWLSCNPTGGTSTGERDTIAVNYTTAGLPAGNYSGTITVTASGAGGSPQTVTVSLRVIPAPELSASPTTLNQGCRPGQNAASQYFEVWNSGGDTVDYTVSENISWLNCNPMSGSSSGERDRIDVNYTTAGLAAGNYSGIITVSAAGVAGSPQIITVNLAVTAAPQLAVDPMSLASDCEAGQDAAVQYFEVWNSGGEAMNYTIDESVSWLNCDRASGSSTGERDRIAVTYATRNLAAGHYNGTITVSAAGAGGSPQTMNVTLTVNSAMLCSLNISPSNTVVTSWEGKPGRWLEMAVRLDKANWGHVPGTDGASRMEMPITNASAFFRVASVTQSNVITQQPRSVAVPESEQATFSVMATGTPPISYQWRLNGVSISGADNTTYSIDSARPSHVGDYSVVVTFGSGSITSSPATLALLAPSIFLSWIPAGAFLMGSPDSEVDRDADEGPQTTVTIRRGFWMGRYEVTQREYIDLIGSNPSYHTNSLNQPVGFLTWDEATAYCAALTQRERTSGRIPGDYAYRLPKEAEWECACRAGTTTRFSYGDDPGYAALGEYAWYVENSGDTTHPVGGKLPNPWGLYDMYGNVWEFCQDWYGNSYSGGSVTDPQGPATGTMHILRGSSYYYAGRPCRSANRGAMETAGKRWDVGFRVVLARTEP
jgi:formylglycine-generating enzyme required for sulfatase activity